MVQVEEKKYKKIEEEKEREISKKAAEYSDQAVHLALGGKPKEAIELFKKALELEPDNANWLTNYAGVLGMLGRTEEALEVSEHILKVRPNDMVTLNNLVASYFKRGECEKAIKHSDTSLRIFPYNPSGLHNRAHAELLLGDYKNGWEHFEWRFCGKPVNPFINCPLWLGGEEIEGKKLLVHHEQGLGDQVQFSRYVKLLKERYNPQIVLCVQEPLVSLFERSYPFCDSVFSRLENKVLTYDPRAADCDFYVPMMSLPLVFETLPETVPNEVPYLLTDDDLYMKWKKRIRSENPKIGVCWSGGLEWPTGGTSPINPTRNCSLDKFMPILDQPGFDFICLQRKIDVSDEAAFKYLLGSGRIKEFCSEFKDFDQTAALIDCLDCVITVDTSIAHVAGALGKPTILMNRFDSCWRWIRGLDYSPWYPTMKVFQQPKMHLWEPVVQRVIDELNRNYQKQVIEHK